MAGFTGSNRCVMEFGTRTVTVACFFIGVVVHNRRVLYSKAHVTFPSSAVVHRITTTLRVLGSITAITRGFVLTKKSNHIFLVESALRE